MLLFAIAMVFCSPLRCAKCVMVLFVCGARKQECVWSPTVMGLYHKASSEKVLLFGSLSLWPQSRNSEVFGL